MGPDDTITMVIHYGGFMKKIEGEYMYVDECGCKTVQCKQSEVTWSHFKDFTVSEKINRSLNLIWFKKSSDEMYELDYTCDESDNPSNGCMFGVSWSELDVYLEHGNSLHEDIEDREGNDGDDERDNVGDQKEHSDCDEEDVDRPKEDEEPAESEDERLGNVGEQDKAIGEDEGIEEDIGDDLLPGSVDPNGDDDGDDVVKDAGDGVDDQRFRTLFEEAEKNEVNEREAYKCDSEEGDSDPEFGLGDVVYPDTPLESEEEWAQWDCRKGFRSNGKDRFHGDYTKEPYLWLFQKFNSGLEFKDQLLRYSLNTQFDIKMAKSEANRIAAVCCVEKCTWRVFCSIERPINKWMVKVCQMTHNHGKNSRVSMLKQRVIAGLFREELRRNPNMQGKEIKDTIKERYHIVVPLSKCYRGRRIALDTILEAQSVQFGKLWDYEAELLRSNPGITTELNTVEVNGVLIFDCFYICFEQLRRQWKSSCRPVIGLDGCFLKWELKGDLVAAVGRDADNKMFPIAWAVVQGETTESWTWFVKKLVADLDLGTGKKLTIISDKSKGLLNAISNVLPDVEHRMCARHIYANWKKAFSRSEYKALFWKVAYSYNLGEYEENLQLVKDYDKFAHSEILRTEPEKWCRAFFTTESHCADVHNNLSEAFNRTIKIARAKPVISMLEDIRRQAMERIARRSLGAAKICTVLTPITMALLEKSRRSNKHCKTHRSGTNLFEVSEYECGYSVSLSSHECACRKWDLTGIPCRHAICVLDDNKEDAENYTAECYYTDLLKNTYHDNIRPVNGEKFWRKTYKVPIGIPEIRQKRGRKKKRDRIKDPFEDLKNKGKATRHGRVPHCSNCLQPGHIKRSCKNEKVVFEGPKNRCGRPRKDPEDGVAPRPKQPRRKRQAPSTGSNTQPVPHGESSASYPAVSSAPQPSSSSRPLKPHQKQPPRKIPLKVSKKPTTATTPIQRTTGQLFSPFTNRPFGIFERIQPDQPLPAEPQKPREQPAQSDEPPAPQE